MVEEQVLGKNYPRVDAADKVSGRSQYAGDVHLPGMLICKVLKSSRPHARILGIDTARAEQATGCANQELNILDRSRIERICNVAVAGMQKIKVF